MVGTGPVWLSREGACRRDRGGGARPTFWGDTSDSGEQKDGPAALEGAGAIERMLDCGRALRTGVSRGSAEASCVSMGGPRIVGRCEIGPGIGPMAVRSTNHTKTHSTRGVACELLTPAPSVTIPTTSS